MIGKEQKMSAEFVRKISAMAVFSTGQAPKQCLVCQELKDSGLTEPHYFCVPLDSLPPAPKPKRGSKRCGRPAKSKR